MYHNINFTLVDESNYNQGVTTIKYSVWIITEIFMLSSAISYRRIILDIGLYMLSHLFEYAMDHLR